MSKNYTPKTSGITYLEYSIVAFNGAGGRGIEDPNRLFDAWRDYKLPKLRPQEREVMNHSEDSLRILCKKLRAPKQPGHITRRASSEMTYTEFQHRNVMKVEIMKILDEIWNSPIDGDEGDHMADKVKEIRERYKDYDKQA